MPLFEYYCQSCHDTFEELVTSLAAPIHCPQCDSIDIRKLVSAFRFKSSASGAGTSPASSACGSCTSKNCSTCR